MTTLHFSALALASLLLVYHQTTTWLPLYPWNDVKAYTAKEMLLEAGSNGLLMGLAIYCLTRANHGFYLFYPLIYYPFLLSGEFFQWWLPFWSPSFAKRQPIDLQYETRFGRTLKFIKHRPNVITPDGNHIVLHALTVVTAIMVYSERLV